jgi:hypothetical protein
VLERHGGGFEVSRSGTVIAATSQAAVRSSQVQVRTMAYVRNASAQRRATKIVAPEVPIVHPEVLAITSTCLQGSPATEPPVAAGEYLPFGVRHGYVGGVVRC